jgi:hypothetical protein
LTVRVPEKAKFLMVMPLDAGSDVPVVPGGAGVVVVLVFAEELHEASRISAAAAPAASEYVFI